jgi:hypothetical protein
MKYLITIAFALIWIQGRSFAEPVPSGPGPLEFLHTFKAPYTIDRNPDRKLLPWGEGLCFDGGTRAVILKDRNGKTFAVVYYGMNAKLEHGKLRLLTVCAFTDSGGWQLPCYSLRRGSSEEAVLARIVLTLPMREDWPELKTIATNQRKSANKLEHRAPDRREAQPS